MRKEFSAEKPIVALTPDLSIYSQVVSATPEMRRFAERHGMIWGSKNILSDEQRDEFAGLMVGVDRRNYPGGGSLGVMATVKNCLGPRFHPKFVTVVGHGGNSAEIRAFHKKTGIELIEIGGNGPTETATAYIVQDGKNTQFIYRGNAHKFLTPNIVTPELLDGVDFVLGNGALLSQVDRENGEEGKRKGVFVKLDQLCWDKNIPMILNLPKSVWVIGEEDVGKFQWGITKSSVILTSQEALARIYGVSLGAAAKKIQQILVDNKNERVHGHQIVMITTPLGAMVVTAEGVMAEENLRLPRDIKEPVLALGTDDMIAAGFLTYIASTGLDIEMISRNKNMLGDALRVGMVLGDAKQNDGKNPRVDEPIKKIKERDPVSAIRFMPPSITGEMEGYTAYSP